ncbi:MAG: hypothetical protein GKS00_02830 [Alphaproteobacteria bacterium]|nr:hypothetical protein [Alphaproteobacteria bacterium]
MGRVILHVGTHKTGTTYLQQNVFPKLPGIKDATGHFPELWRMLGLLSDENPIFLDVGRIADLCRTIVQPYPIFLISWERFSGDPYRCFFNNGTTAENLGAIFPEADLIFVFRRQDNWAESLYRHTIRRGFSVSPKKFIGYRPDGTFDRNLISRNYTVPTLDVASLDWSTYVENYERVFNRCLFLPYEDFAMEKEGFVKKITDFLDVTAAESLRDVRSNEGYSDVSLFFARIINLLNLGRVSDSLAGRVLKRLNRVVSRDRFLTGVVNRAFPARSASLPEDAMRRILDMHREGNRRLDERLGLGLERHGYY